MAQIAPLALSPRRQIRKITPSCLPQWLTITYHSVSEVHRNFTWHELLTSCGESLNREVPATHTGRQGAGDCTTAQVGDRSCACASPRLNNTTQEPRSVEKCPFSTAGLHAFRGSDRLQWTAGSESNSVNHRPATGAFRFEIA